MRQFNTAGNAKALCKTIIAKEQHTLNTHLNNQRTQALDSIKQKRPDSLLSARIYTITMR